MAELLAGSTTHTSTPEDLMHGGVKTNSFTAPIGFTCVRGEVVCFEAGKLVKLIEAKKALAFGVMVHTQTAALAAENELPVYIGGQVNSDKITLNTVALSDVIAPLSRRGITINKFGA